ncbi:NADH:ubiquinone reductase (Na(+)-transporting) subunit C [Cognataquiflexum aquatile]|uniref:NADH:ubiquinone reductase (Na(+)-transporting) subunit C n=1 Tax=Cognataquiflexum aquatile TaxID=2249427 RepID=UPI000DEBEB19|nr:NADH:ubiquinone reductase (Na(+)-transporting) subunit C [Cognataquiflexum aquatile]
MQQSNTYIITFSAILTIILGLLLSGSSQILGPLQRKAEELDTKKQILGAVVDGDQLGKMKPEEVLSFYESRISSKVVDIEGKVIETAPDGSPVVAEKVNVGKNYKMAPENRMYPIFIYHAEGNPESVESYILPVYGAGLWDEIWGYVALQTDLSTIEGVTFAHKAETPGLGARITSSDVQERYQGKKIFDESGKIQSVYMQKGEGKDYESDLHKVDGMSGATITANGVNKMLKNYLEYYSAFLSSQKAGQQTEVVAVN